MTVLIGFSTSKAWYSRVIRKLTGAAVSHTFLVFDSVDAQCKCVLEAANIGFRPIPFWRWLMMGHQLVAAYECKTVDLAPEVQWALENWDGADYSWGGLFGMAVVLLGRWLRVKLRNPARSAKTNFCSEANAKLLRRACAPHFKLSPAETSPQDLLKWCARPESGCVAVDVADLVSP